MAFVSLAIAVVVGLMLGTAQLGFGLFDRLGGTDGEVFREPAAEPGPNPFTDPVTSPGRPDVPSGQPPGATPGGGTTLRGNTPALYGGTRSNTSCDRAALVAFLQANPSKGAAWASAQGIRPEEIPSFVARLTPVLLRADTRVTNHGYQDGTATRLQSVLQAGSAVWSTNLAFRA